MEKTRLSHVCDDALEEEFLERSRNWELEVDSSEFALRMDDEDPLKNFRKLFYYPKKKYLENIDASKLEDPEEECLYFCGQSLGLQLKSVEQSLKKVLANWAKRGVESHLKGFLPASSSDNAVKGKMAYMVGADDSEVTVMNALTINIHIMLSSFYRPTATRYKILMVEGGFHSDLYAVQSHVAFRGYDPDESLIFLKPQEGEYTTNRDDVLQVIREQGSEIALIFIEGLHFYTGELYDIEEITRVGHEQGCVVGFDLAHAIGNVELKLHDWNVDFAMWCTYKYLNSGAGSMGAIFVHRSQTEGVNGGLVPALTGWWGLSLDRRFAFDKHFTPEEGSDRFKMSNPSPFLSAMMLPNLEVFAEAGIDRLLAKQRLLTGYLEYLLRKHFPQDLLPQPLLKIITPRDPSRRGSQLSLISSVPLDRCESILVSHGLICDVRRPSVIRITPIPLYNTFSEVYICVHILKDIWKTMAEEENVKK